MFFSGKHAKKKFYALYRRIKSKSTLNKLQTVLADIRQLGIDLVFSHSLDKMKLNPDRIYLHSIANNLRKKEVRGTSYPTIDTMFIRIDKIKTVPSLFRTLRHELVHILIDYMNGENPLAPLNLSKPIKDYLRGLGYKEEDLEEEYTAYLMENWHKQVHQLARRVSRSYTLSCPVDVFLDQSYTEFRDFVYPTFRSKFNYTEALLSQLETDFLSDSKTEFILKLPRYNRFFLVNLENKTIEKLDPTDFVLVYS